MRETQWRDKIVREYKKVRPHGFIWAMDSHFKAGFPDLYIVESGVSVHVELKIGKLLKEPRLLLDPIQLVTLQKLKAAGAHVFVVALNETTKIVSVTDLEHISYYSEIYFLRQWLPFINTYYRAI